MEWYVTISIGLSLLLGLFLLGLPIFLAFFVVIVGGVTLTLGPRAYGMVVNSVYESATTASLGTVFLFILLGEVLFRSGCLSVLMESLDRLVGRVRGRHYFLSILLATVLGALSGSAMAVGAMMGRALLPDMITRQYNVRLSVGTILGGACLAPIIPPSILAIIVAMLAKISISSLLIAGVIPGLLLAALFVSACALRVWMNPALAPEPEISSSPERTFSLGRALVGLLPFSVIIFCVIGFILLGIATPSESAATGVVGALAVAAMYRKLSWKMIYETFAEAAMMSAVILIIIASAIMFTQLLAFTGATAAMTRLVAELDVNQYVLLFLMLLVPFFLCMFIDGLGLMLILVPIYAPIVNSIGWDPIWFWLLFLINITLGAITPPFGYVIFALKAAAPGVALKDIFAGAWLFVMLTAIGLFIMVIFPQIVIFLPNILTGR